MIKNVLPILLILILSTGIFAQDFANFNVEKDPIYKSFLSQLKGSEVYELSFKFLRDYEAKIKQLDSTAVLKVFDDFQDYNNKIIELIVKKTLKDYNGNFSLFNAEADAFIEFYKELFIQDKLYPFYLRKLKLIEVNYIQVSSSFKEDIILYYEYLCKSDFRKANFLLNWIIKNNDKLNLCEIKLDMLRLSLYERYTSIDLINIILNDLDKKLANTSKYDNCNDRNFILKAKIIICINRIKLQKHENLQEDIIWIFESIDNLQLSYVEEYTFLLNLSHKYAVETKNDILLYYINLELRSYFSKLDPIWTLKLKKIEKIGMPSDILKTFGNANKVITVNGKLAQYIGDMMFNLDNLQKNYLIKNDLFENNEETKTYLKNIGELVSYPFLMQKFMNENLGKNIFNNKFNFVEEGILLVKLSYLIDGSYKIKENDETFKSVMFHLINSKTSISKSRHFIYLINNLKNNINIGYVLFMAIENDIDLLNNQFYYLPELEQLEIQNMITANYQSYQKIIRQEKINNRVIKELIVLSQYIKNTNVNSTNFIIENQDLVSKDLFSQWQDLKSSDNNDKSFQKINNTEALIKSELKNLKKSKILYKDSMLAGLNIDFGFYNHNSDPFFNLKEDSILYYAMIYDEKANFVKVVDLCSEKELKRIFQKSSIDSKGINILYATRSSTGSESVFLPNVNDDLYDMVIKPIEQYINSNDTINYTLSGLLSTLNIEAIQDVNGNLMGNKYNMNLKSTIIKLEPKFKSSFQKMAIIGDITFNSYSYLAASKQEVDSIGFVAKDYQWKTNLFYNTDANKRNILDNLKKNDNNIVFFSTHGTVEYIGKVAQQSFGGIGVIMKIKAGKVIADSILINGSAYKSQKIKNGCEILAMKEEGGNEVSFVGLDLDQVVNLIRGKTGTRILIKVSDEKGEIISISLVREKINIDYTSETKNNNTSIRSTFKYYKSLSQAGLIVKDSENNDVLLSALEISKLNLSNTNLVVLSACETGLGQIEGYEGVVGLQRGFKIAGADKLLMTLWSVSDDHTKDFMIDFMKGYFKNPEKVKEVFKKTVNNIRAKYPDPYYWAGFILLE